MPRPFRVYPILGLGLLAFTASPILVRFASEAPGLALAVWRTAFAVLILAPWALPKIGPELRRMTRREWLLISASGVLLGLHFVFWIESLYHTTVASASVLVTTNPIFIALLGFLLLGERVAGRVVAAIGIGVFGAVLIGVGDAGAPSGAASNPLLGNGLALTAALFFSVYLLIGRVVRQHYSWLAYVFPLYTIVAITTLVLALVFGTPLFGFGWEIYGLCVLMALGPSITGHGSFNYAVRYFPVALLGLLGLLEPVGASVAAFLLFGEVPPVVAVVGMLLVLVGVAVAMRPRRGERGSGEDGERERRGTGEQ